MLSSQANSPSATTVNKLTFAIASTQKTWHGGESQASLLAHGLRERGHTCTIFARAGSEFAVRMHTFGFRVIAFAGRGRAPWTWWSLRRELITRRPDVLFCNDPHALTSLGAASYKLPIPVRLAARRVDFPVRSTAKYLAFADATVCVSRAIRDICVQAGIPSTRLFVVPDGADPAFVARGDRQRGRAALQLTPDATLLLVIAKLTDHKGHRYLLQALPEVLRHYPHVQLALAGDGELRNELQQHALAVGLENNVRFLGYRDDVPDLLAAADLVVQPSHMEGLCSSLIDAMLAAKPIVATRAGGIPDLLDPTMDERFDAAIKSRHVAPEDANEQRMAAVAWLAEVRSSTSLATQILDALGDPTEREYRGHRSRQRALEQFTASQLVDRTLAICQQLRTNHRAA